MKDQSRHGEERRRITEANGKIMEKQTGLGGLRTKSAEKKRGKKEVTQVWLGKCR